MSYPRSVILRLALAMLFLVPGTAHGQDALARAREAFDRAELEAAIAAYDEAAAGDGLSRAELMELLRGRALARHAARDVAGAEQDLVALLSLDPDAELGEMAPPALQRSFARLRGEVSAPLAIEVSVTPLPDGFRVRTTVREDVASLVREIRVHARTDGEWSVEAGDDVAIVADRLEYAVEAIGPGGAVIAHEGTREDPRTIEAPRVEPEPEAPAPAGDDTVAIAVGVSVGAAAVIAAVAIVLAVVLAPGGVQVSAPMEMR